MPRPPRRIHRALLLSISLVLLFTAAAVGTSPEAGDGLARGGEPTAGPSEEETPPPPPEEECEPPGDFGGNPLPSGAFALSGTVTDEAAVVGGLGAIEVRITAYSGIVVVGHDRIFTEPDGTWTMPGVDDGAYTIAFYDYNAAYQGGFLGTGGLVPTPADAEPVVVSGADAAGIDIALPAEQSREISGSITNADGDPVAGIKVSVDANLFPMNGCATSQGNGSYAVSGLRAGVYRLRVSDPSGTYPTGFYSASAPGHFTGSIGQATLIVAYGVDAAGINIQYPPTLSLSGSTSTTTGDPIQGVNLEVCGGGLCGYAQSGPDGTFTITGLPAGDYVVRARGLYLGYIEGYYGPGGFALDLVDATVVSVAADVTGVDLVLPSAPTISGVVTDHLDVGLGAVLLTFSTADFSYFAQAVTNPDGTYATTWMQPGSYTVHVYDFNGLHPQGYRVAGGSLVADPGLADPVVLGSVELDDVDVQIPQGGALDVHLTRGGNPAFAIVNICLSPTNCVIEASQFGVVPFWALLPGPYLIGTWSFEPDGQHRLWYVAGDVASEDSGDATPVTIVAGTSASIDLSMPYPDAETPTGADVPTQFDDGAGSVAVSLSFDNVTGGGTTSLTVPAVPPPAPAGFQLGDPPISYEISTTATFVGDVEVCIHFNPASFTDPDSVALLHFDPAPPPGSWVDITTTLDGSTGIVCGLTDSFSPFVLAEPSFAFGGFHGQKIPPKKNAENAGDKVAIQFSLGGDAGLDIFAAGSPSWQKVNCNTLVPSGAAGPAQAAAPLKYNATTGRYKFTWQTKQGWEGTCRLLTLTFSNGESAQLIFKFQ